MAAFPRVFLIGMLCAAPAHAYMDPGTGSMLLQIILGGLAGLAVAGKLFWHRILSVLGLRKSETLPGPDQPESEDH